MTHPHPQVPRRQSAALPTITVQQSFPKPRPTTNPYIVLLGRSLAATPGIRLRTFSWRSALLARSDVFHAHWPEILVTGASPAKTLVRQALFVLLMVKLAVTRTPIVRTVHNLELPSGLSRVQRILLTWFDRRTVYRIALNADTPLPDAERHALIPHGHLRDWFAPYPVPATVPGRFGYFGLIRRYKNVEALVDAFAGMPGDVSLLVAGKPSSEDLASDLRRRAAADPRITLRLEFLSDEALATVAGESELVVLPYRHMHNSGAVLTALSLDRPVLVPANAANAQLADEVGPGWVLQYDGDLTQQRLLDALRARREAADGGRPDLSARDWSRTGEAHRAAYLAAVRLAGQSRRYSR